MGNISRRKRLIKAWRMAVKAEVEATATPGAIAGAKQHLAQPQVINRLVDLVGEFIVRQVDAGTPLVCFLRGKPVEAKKVIHRALIEDDFLQELAPMWLKICHWAAWDRALREMDVWQDPSEDILKAARPLVVAIAEDPEHKAACLEDLTTIVAKAGLPSGTKPSEIPQTFREAFQEKGD